MEGQDVDGFEAVFGLAGRGQELARLVLVEIPSELLGRAHAVLQNRLIDIHPAHPIGIGGHPVPHVLDPQDR